MSGQAGSAPLIEIALGAPIIMVMVWLVIWAATAGQTPGQVRLAAQDAARLAATTRTAADRPATATGLVDGRLAGSDCTSWTTATSSTDTAITVIVTCQLATDQMAGLHVGTRTTTATGRAAIDPYFLQN